MEKKIVHVVIDQLSEGFVKWDMLLDGLNKACMSSGMALQTHFPNELTQLMEESSGPIILTGTDEMFLRDVIDNMKNAGRHVILAGIDAEQFGANISCASPSRRQEAQQMVDYLYSCGCRKFALLGFGLRSMNDRLRLDSARETIRELGLSYTPEDEYSWLDDPDSCINDFLPNALRYDAVITPNDVLAVILSNSLAAVGIHVPEQLYIAGFGNMKIGELHTPGITTTAMDMNTIGKQAFTAWQLLRQDTTGRLVFRIIVPCRIIVRESTAGRRPSECSTPAKMLAEDPYYHNPTIKSLEAMERCLINLDPLDFKIASDLREGYTNDNICERQYISEGALRYRLGKIYANAEVGNRRQLLKLVDQVFGDRNPFTSGTAKAK